MQVPVAMRLVTKPFLVTEVLSVMQMLTLEPLDVTGPLPGAMNLYQM